MQNRNMVYTVTLANGVKIGHTYDVPTDVDVASKWADYTTKMITQALSKRDVLVSFTNPLYFYNPNFVMSIDFAVIGSGIPQNIKDRLEKPPMGFHK